MIAIVSGRARRALIGDGERWSAIDADDLVNPVVWHGRDLRAAFHDATDLEFFHDVPIEEVRQRLVEACDRTAALHLSLLGLDPSLSDETRRAALTELEDLVVRGAGEFVRAVLFARPLSDSHDLAGALRLGAGPEVRAVYVELERSQPHVRAVFEAWEAIPDASFLGVKRRDCRARLVRGGWFYRLSMALAERADERPTAVLARMRGASNLRDVRELPDIAETWARELTSPARVERAPEPAWVRERLATIIQQVPQYLAKQFPGLLNSDTRREIAVEAAAQMWQKYSASPSDDWDDEFAYKWAVTRSSEYLQGVASQTGRTDNSAHPALVPSGSEPPDPSAGPEAIAEAREILQRAMAEIARLRPEHVREAMSRYLMRSHDDAVEYLGKARGMTRDEAVRFIDRYRRSVQRAMESATTPGKPGDGREETTMMMSPGQRVSHAEFGEGVIIGDVLDGFVRVFFALGGERQVPLAALRDRASPSDRMLEGVAADPERSRRAWLAVEAHALPLMDSASSLTAAKVDLLPHQIVLTHRVAIASPRRFLVADEVGLGKTIETALILRELASRGELRRALMVVPAGLVNNWHRELNEVFRLDFEVFGSEGDVTDRKTNAFAKHDRLIASVDTLKQERRVRRLLEAPRWDLVVFDEAHHLTAYRTGKKVTRTENYKLAEALRGHTRDLLLLSATPHQGDHFRFWMLVQLLNPTLFNSADEMVENRHRLNEVVFRRTKADACRADGTPLFARREVHTDSFTMTDAEAAFYDELLKYLQDGFALAKREGGKGRALGFVMAIFQKIAASSFAAVRTTLRRRLLALTVHEAVLRDKNLDIDGRQKLYDEARALIREDHGLGSDLAASNQVDRILSDWKALVIEQVEEAAERAADTYGAESAQIGAEDLVAKAVSLALPEERLRIGDLLGRFPRARETKVERLLEALGQLWKENAAEKVVVFATYLSTVDMLAREIEGAFPGTGVAVLRGGDHGAKLAAEKRFRLKDGPRVLICTAAGREGINLQFARVLFNFDLPWNPMDVEQRIGRIHRYGQRDTAQVYNLILSDTIEGRIFLLLDDKLREIARALGKVDERGEVAEDLRTQILGQLSERLRYDQLYQEAISDPELRRTRLEVENALRNANEARQVVFSLFQDLEGFNLDDYKPLGDIAGSVERMLRYFGAATADTGKTLATTGPGRFEVRDRSGAPLLRFTTDRDLAREDDSLDLFGLDHPLMQEALRRWREAAPESLGLAVRAGDDPAGVLTAWFVETHGPRGERSAAVQFLAADAAGHRLPALERRAREVFERAPVASPWGLDERKRVLHGTIEPMLQREVQRRPVSPEKGGFSSQLLGWVEVVP